MNGKQASNTPQNVTLPGKKTRNWQPDLPLQDNSIFNLSRGPINALKVLYNSWLPITDRLIFVAVSVLAWLYLSPPFETARSFSFEWVALVYLRNLALMVLLASGMHLYLYTFKRQGNYLRYDARTFHKKKCTVHH